MIVYIVFSYFFMLGTFTVPGISLKWYNLVLAPIAMPMVAGQFMAIIIHKNNQAIGKKDLDGK
jgi:hypothetical protein